MRIHRPALILMPVHTLWASDLLRYTVRLLPLSISLEILTVAHSSFHCVLAYLRRKFFPFYLLCASVFCLHAYLCGDAGVTDSCELPCVHSKLNLGPLELHPLFLTTEPSISPGSLRLDQCQHIIYYFLVF